MRRGVFARDLLLTCHVRACVCLCACERARVRVRNHLILAIKWQDEAEALGQDAKRDLEDRGVV